MNSEKQRIAGIVKRGREKKGFTQAELAAKTSVSLRSIQRIEKAEVLPRAYTLNLLEESLDCSFQNENTSSNIELKLRKKIILSVSSLLIMILAAFAYLFQATKFPETTFESMLFWILIVILITLVQWEIWIGRKTSKI